MASLGLVRVVGLVALGLIAGCTSVPWQSTVNTLPAVEAVKVRPVIAELIANNLTEIMAYPYPPRSSTMRLLSGTGEFHAAIEKALRQQGYGVSTSSGAGADGDELGFVIDAYQSGLLRATLIKRGWRVDRLYQETATGVIAVAGGLQGEHVPLVPLPVEPEVEKPPVSEVDGTVEPAVVEKPKLEGGFYIQLMAGKQVNVLQKAKNQAGKKAVLVPLENGLTALRIPFKSLRTAQLALADYRGQYPNSFVGGNNE